ncbi:C-terminal binding protein [Brachybacterium endophyticum]|uniref:C-terminal binding protein n=1 Tax=Brachybacterium endophyticum TaxID=2182385 RepID=A0A2U2RMK2_9MICO|nr:C-terminal binding protein [Brachybacterium endophyticum]PWH07107.1 C-terminal binding protein [Brachybacterium endophyticum]
MENHQRQRITIVDCDQESFVVEQEVAGAAGIELVKAQATTEDEVIAAAQGADAILVQYAPITDRVLEALPGLRAVGRYGVGVDTVDLEAATAHGVPVCNVPDYSIEDVSDHAIALALTLVRGTAQLDRRLRAGQYGLAAIKPLHRVREQTFGVVGLGRIGRATAQKARALGFTVIGSDPMLEVGSSTDDGTPVVPFEDLLEGSDVISLHVPLTAGTHHLIDAAALARMRSGAMLVNTCRGGVVDTEALLAALGTGRPRSAALDVFETEPIPAGSPLLNEENLVLTPHASWYSEESETELKRRITEAMVTACRGETPPHVVNPGVLTG